MLFTKYLSAYVYKQQDTFLTHQETYFIHFGIKTLISYLSILNLTNWLYSKFMSTSLTTLIEFASNLLLKIPNKRFLRVRFTYLQ